MFCEQLVIEEVAQNKVLFLHGEGHALLHFLVVTYVRVLVEEVVG